MKTLQPGRCRRGFTIAWPAVLLLIVLGMPTVAAAQTGSVTGVVRSEDSGAPLPGATVELIGLTTTASAIADAGGRYSVGPVTGGRAVLRVRHVGHREFELQLRVPGNRPLVVNVTLEVEPVALDPVNVDAQNPDLSADVPAATPEDLAQSAALAMQATSGLSEIGLSDAIRGIPGREPTDPGSMLYVRGAASDLKLVHLDGAPVYAPFPLGGLLDPFGPSLLESADIYLGGAPARYDGGLSYVMDLKTRRPTQPGVRTRGSLDVLSMTAIAEAGVADRASAVASYRSMLPAEASGILGRNLPYDYSELLLRGDVLLSESTALSATGFTNRESVLVEQTANGPRPIDWGNDAASLRLRTRLGTTAAEVAAALGSYQASLPLRGGAYQLATGDADRVRLFADFLSPVAGSAVRWGASFERQDYRATILRSDRSPYALGGDGRVVGGYGELSLQPAANVRLRAGGRLDHFSNDGVRLAPRAAATWLVTENAALTLAAGRYHQYVRPPEDVLIAAESGSVAIARPLVVGSATHVTAGLDQFVGAGMRFGLDAFYKRFSEMPSTVSPNANASGVDLWLRRGVADGISGWIGYSLAWVWSRSDDPQQNDFSGRHLLNTGADLSLGADTELRLRFAYGAGLPYAGIPVEFQAAVGVQDQRAISNEALSAADRGGTESAPLLYTPDEPFLRVDLALSRRWEQGMAGRKMEIAPFVRLINGIGDRDALFYFFDNDYQEPTPIGSIPMIPIVGLEWKF